MSLELETLDQLLGGQMPVAVIRLIFPSDERFQQAMLGLLAGGDIELVDGGNLAQKLGHRPQPAREAAALVETLARAVHALHQRGIIHRDLKPSNVLLSADGTPKLTDFGVAKLTSTNLTRTGTVVGTPSYMSPEQVTGQPVSGASDQFSIAVILYQMLCGRLPFDGESMAQLMFKIANEPAPDILQFNPRLPPALVAFLDRAMAKEADERFQTGDEFAQALRSCISTQKPQVDITI